MILNSSFLLCVHEFSKKMTVITFQFSVRLDLCKHHHNKAVIHSGEAMATHSLVAGSDMMKYKSIPVLKLILIIVRIQLYNCISTVLQSCVCHPWRNSKETFCAKRNSASACLGCEWKGGTPLLLSVIREIAAD